MTTVPILLIAFNRPENTKKVLEALEVVKPQFLFVAADGPRKTHPEDVRKCSQTRDLFNTLPWKCTIHKLFRNENFGCGKGPSDAISWFFQNVEEGIILEDDCFPSPDFFFFCEVMLSKYRYETKVFQIAGTNFLETWKSNNQGYHFSIFSHTWGWATWKRVWEKYDYTLTNWGTEDSYNQLQVKLNRKKEFAKLKSIFDNTKENNKGITWWDFQFCFTILINDGLCLVPSVNLITNIGVGPDSTHTNNPSDIGTPSLPLFTLDRSKVLRDYPLIADKTFDKKYFKRSFLKPAKLHRRLIKLILRLVSGLKNN
jgi:hypothetical protein